MGQKADKLQEELELTESELRAEQNHNRELREQIIAMGGTPKGAHGAESSGGSTSLQRRPQLDDASEGAGGSFATTSYDDGADDGAEEAIRQLRNPEPSPERRETVLEIVQANNREREQLNALQKSANNLISRIAGALQVGRWDSEGTELLEKLQRFSTFEYFLKKRMQDAVNMRAACTSDADRACKEAVVDELRAIITAYVAPSRLSKFLIDKPSGRATAGMMDTAFDPNAVVGTITAADLTELAQGKADKCPEWLYAASKSPIAMTELLDLLNLVLYPTLVRMRLVEAE